MLTLMAALRNASVLQDKNTGAHIASSAIKFHARVNELLPQQQHPYL
jgi:hypothetical protein